MCFKTYLNHPINKKKRRSNKKPKGDHSSQKRGGGGRRGMIMITDSTPKLPFRHYFLPNIFLVILVISRDIWHFGRKWEITRKFSRYLDFNTISRDIIFFTTFSLLSISESMGVTPALRTDEKTDNIVSDNLGLQLHSNKPRQQLQYSQVWYSLKNCKTMS